MVLAIQMPGVPEMLIIFLVVLLVFGAKRIPEIARGLGKGIREFKDATTDIKRELTVDESRPQVRAPQHQGYAQQPYAAQQTAPPSPPPVTPPAPPPAPQAPPSSLTEPAYPQGTSYAQPAPDGTIDTPQAPPPQHG